MIQGNWEKQEEAAQLCTCDHYMYLHGTEICNWGEGTSTGCSCSGFQRAHQGRRPNCWCSVDSFSDENVKAHESDVSDPKMVPAYFEDALGQVRADLVDLARNLDGAWKDQPDIALRVDNWRLNTSRHIEDILAAAVT